MNALFKLYAVFKSYYNVEIYWKLLNLKKIIKKFESQSSSNQYCPNICKLWINKYFLCTSKASYYQKWWSFFQKKIKKWLYLQQRTILASLSNYSDSTVFKEIKQLLKIKNFLVITVNAVLIQIPAAMIAMLILKYLKGCATYSWR